MGIEPEVTYIGMSSDLLNDLVIEMTRVAQEVSSDVVRVFHALEDIAGDRELRPLSELGSLGLTVEVDVLHPAMVVAGGCLGNMFLEDDDVGVGNLYRIRGRKERSETFVDGLGAEGWCR